MNYSIILYHFNRRNLFLLLSTIILLKHPTMGQRGFEPGFVITNSGDTIRGEIRIQNNTSIAFRPTASVAPIKYTHNEVSKFWVNNIFYVSARWEDDDKTVSAFLRERVQGRVGLYSLPNEVENKAFVLRLPDQTFLLLTGKMAWSLLNRQLTECPNQDFMYKLQPQYFRYTYSYFEDIILKYNRCINPAQTHVTRKLLSYQTGIQLGGSQNRWNFTSWSAIAPSGNPNGMLPEQNTFTAGAYIIIRPRKRISFQLEGYYSYYQAQKKVNNYDPFNPYQALLSFMKFDQHSLVLPFTSRFAITNGPVRWYIKAGPTPSYDISKTVKQTVRFTNGEEQTYIIHNQKNLNVGILAGSGVEIKLNTKRSVFAELRGISGYVLDGGNVIARSRSIQAIVGISLFER